PAGAPGPVDRPRLPVEPLGGGLPACPGRAGRPAAVTILLLYSPRRPSRLFGQIWGHRFTQRVSRMQTS
ncbi:hypothetical protein, partial [Streptomyces sp. NPDC005877]|uniref:hypothetical protein n=1 Tax=Streptomyces sp. NPDC005877 TaxID=3155346 RepID=UPI0033C44517